MSGLRRLSHRVNVLLTLPLAMTVWVGDHLLSEGAMTMLRTFQEIPMKPPIFRYQVSGLWPRSPLPRARSKVCYHDRPCSMPSRSLDSEDMAPCSGACRHSCQVRFFAIVRKHRVARQAGFHSFCYCLS